MSNKSVDSLPDLSKEVWEQNYRADGENTVQDTWERQAKACSAVEKEEIRAKVYEDFKWLLTDFKGIAGGRITANLGVAREGTTLMNCFVQNPSDINYKDVDSIEGIYSMLKAQALTLKSEGGYGMNFSWIRPAGTYINGIDSRTPGVLKFMELWDKSSEIITMGSETIIGERHKGEKKKIRKGAQMGILSIWHPEIETFIDAKLTPNRLTKFNLSIGITNGFMDAVNAEADWNLEFPDTTFIKYKSEWFGDIYKWKALGYPVIVYKTMKARELWDKIMKATYTRNEPGVLFLDLANKLNPLSYAEDIYTTNPCGEIAMSTGVCNLLSLNLTQYCTQTEIGKFVFDYEKFKKAIKIAVRFSDNINDISPAPLPEYVQSMTEKRRIGIGTLGLGSLHYMLNIRFGTPESLTLIDSIYKVKAETEIIASAELGVEKGSFKLFDKKQYFNTYWWKNIPISNEVKQLVESIGCMRNSHRSANAPTGNMSIYAGIMSGGIEPVFMKEYIRWVIVPEADRAELRAQGFEFPDILKGEWFETKHMKIVKNGAEETLLGSFNKNEYQVDKNRGLTICKNVEDYGIRFVRENYSPEDYKKMDEAGIFATTENLGVYEHINTLKAIAKYVDMNSSKTVNIVNEYPYDEFKNVYMDAWKAGIKGITTYRDGTMTAVLTKKENTQEKQEKMTKMLGDSNDGIIHDNVSLPDEYFSKGYNIKDAHTKKKWYINIAFWDHSYVKPFGIFVSTNAKEGSEVADSTVEAMFALAKEMKIPKKWIDDQRMKCENQSNVIKIARSISLLLRHNVPIIDIVNVLDDGNYPLSSLTFHIKRLMKQFIKDGTVAKGKSGKCIKCGGDYIFQEGCVLCMSCGSSKCG